MAPRLGELHHKARLTVEKVLNMRHDYRIRGVTYMDLANKYDVGVGTVSAVLLHKTWRHVECDCCLRNCTYWSQREV
jgi:hypothetical protein